MDEAKQLGLMEVADLLQLKNHVLQQSEEIREMKFKELQQQVTTPTGDVSDVCRASPGLDLVLRPPLPPPLLRVVKCVHVKRLFQRFLVEARFRIPIFEGKTILFRLLDL